MPEPRPQLLGVAEEAEDDAAAHGLPDSSIPKPDPQGQGPHPAPAIAPLVRVQTDRVRAPSVAPTPLAPALPTTAELVMEQLRSASLAPVDRSALLLQYKELTEEDAIVARRQRLQEERDNHLQTLGERKAAENERSEKAALQYRQDEAQTKQRISFARYQTLIRYILGFGLIAAGIYLLIHDHDPKGCYTIGLGAALAGVASGVKWPPMLALKKGAE